MATCNRDDKQRTDQSPAFVAAGVQALEARTVATMKGKKWLQGSSYYSPSIRAPMRGTLQRC